MNTYTIDLAKWRCGDDSDIAGCRLGEGTTAMLTANGFMCCLGQFAHQRGYGEFCAGNGDPSEVARDCGAAYDELFVRIDFDTDDFATENTRLADECIYINDNGSTDIWTKLCLLAERMNREGLTLLVTGKLPA